MFALHSIRQGSTLELELLVSTLTHQCSGHKSTNPGSRGLRVRQARDTLFHPTPRGEHPDVALEVLSKTIRSDLEDIDTAASLSPSVKVVSMASVVPSATLQIGLSDTYGALFIGMILLWTFVGATALQMYVFLRSGSQTNSAVFVGFFISSSAPFDLWLLLLFAENQGRYGQDSWILKSTVGFLWYRGLASLFNIRSVELFSRTGL